MRVTGQVVVHQAPPSAKGVHFITLEDELGLLDVIVQPALYARFRRVLHSASLLAVAGVVQRRGAVINVIAQHAAYLDGR